MEPSPPPSRRTPIATTMNRRATPCASSIGSTTRSRRYDFVVAKKAEFLRFDRREMTSWDALDYLNTLVDDSDPDIALPQIDHCCRRPKRFAPTAIRTGWC